MSLSVCLSLLLGGWLLNFKASGKVQWYHLLLYREAFGVGLAVFVCLPFFFYPYNQNHLFPSGVFFASSRVGLIRTSSSFRAAGTVLGIGINRDTMAARAVVSTAVESQ